ncbi:Arginyl-tRNA--protein transferase 1 [Fusarium chlamydosporum]
MYRPDQRRSCCPHYTIRLDSNQFKPSRDQRQTINRFNKFVLGDSYIKEASRLYPRSREESKKRDNHFDLVERIHEAEDANTKNPPESAHKFVVTLEHDDFTEEKFAVYENYQRVLTFEERDNDGKLVAIGVLDLLPECVSSVYFLYHESIHQHAPGKLGALYEIALAIEEGYGWWYPGFYIHSCPKMRYKIDYSPQFVLDPDSLTWDPLDREMLDLLDKKPFVSLSFEKKQTFEGDHLNSSVPSEEVKASDSPETKGSDSSASSDEGDSDWLFTSGMPGIPPIASATTWDMDHIALKIAPGGPLYETSDLVSWDERGVKEHPGLKAAVAELVAATGPDLMDRICIDFAPRR